MPWTNKHMSWLVDTETTITIASGQNVPIFEFRHTSDGEILSAWARHFRNHYCRDTEIDELRHGTPYSRAEYLKAIKFPDRSAAPGPSVRSGDMAEILVADYLEFVLNYWVPRTRYSDKTIRNESTKGSDILGLKILHSDRESQDDTLAIFEAKALLAAVSADSRLQEAIDGSAKDRLRKAESLNAAKQRLLRDRDADGATRVERFQNLEDRPYKEKYGAVALFTSTLFSQSTECTATAASHPNPDDLSLLVIHGSNLMALVHDLYERAANEA